MRLCSCAALAAIALSGCTLDATGAGGAATTATDATGATMSSTSNFMPTTATGMSCNDGKIDPGEQCDGADLGSQTCKLQGFTGGQLKCNATCALDVSGCVATCGDGVKQANEACDGADLGGHTCVEKGYVSPAGVVCADCALDFGGCMAVCGNGTVEAGELCDDGNTIDTDTCPANCLPGTGGTCGSAVVVNVTPGNTVTQTGNLEGGGAHASGDPACPHGGADRVYAITPSTNGFLTAWMPRPNAQFDGALWIAATCDQVTTVKPLLCNDTFAADPAKSRGGEVVSVPVAAGSVYYVFVEAKQSTGSLPYELRIRLSAGTCADPVPVTFVEGAPQTVLGNNANAPKTASAETPCSGGNGGGEVVYELRNPFDDTTRVDLVGDHNVVLYARDQCGGGAQLDCSNSVIDSDDERIDVSVPPSSPAFVYVDGGDPAPSGDYRLTFTQ